MEEQERQADQSKLNYPNQGPVKETLEYLQKYFPEINKFPRRISEEKRDKIQKVQKDLKNWLEIALKNNSIPYDDVYFRLNQWNNLSDIENIFSKQAAWDRVRFENRLKSLMRDKQSFLREDGVGASIGDFGTFDFTIPTIGHFGFRSLNDLFPMPVYPIGVTRIPLSVDGATYDSTGFTSHDFEHTNQMHESRFQLMDFFDGTSKKLTPISLMRVMKTGLATKRKFRKAISTLSSAKERLIGEGILFHCLHETPHEGVNFSEIRNEVNRLVLQKGSGLVERFANPSDFGQAFKYPPSKTEVLKVLKDLQRNLN